jgi:Fe-S-cluster-containing dehydrogenase component/formate-dependent nitrite reductase membrane component NrfD
MTTAPTRWGKVIDQSRCIGCHACSTACKSENLVPLSVHRTFVKSVDVGVFPEARRAFQVTRCNQCEDAPCVAACPTTAMYQRSDGIVDFDKSICIGCKACIAACPYDAIFINPEDHSAEKCNFCAHRVDVGLEPACVTVCPTNAILIGDLDDPESGVAKIVGREVVAVRRPEKETRPKLFYKGAHQATLDPLAPRHPDGGLYAWSERAQGAHAIPASASATMAAALVSYDVEHRAPWDWRVSLYTFTKGVASGAYLVALALVVLGVVGPASRFWLFGAPVVAGAFLAATGIVLIADLEHPSRFYLIFTKRQWRSWLVRGAFVIAGYSAVLGLHFGAAVEGAPPVARLAAIAGVPLAVMTAIYTAYLFAQSTGRDMWQSALLAPHLLVQAVLAGSAVLLPVASVMEPAAVSALAWMLGIACAAHVALVVAETSIAHPTAHARLASRAMTAGAYRGWFRFGLALVAAASLAPWLGPSIAAPLALLGLFAHEHAYVQAGQSIPLA